MRIVLVIFNDRIEAFSSLKPFYEKYRQFEAEKSKIEYNLSRKNIAYKTDFIEIRRLGVQKSAQ